MDQFVDVVGEATRNESAARHCGELCIKVHGGTAERAFQSLAKKTDEARTRLAEAGVAADEQFEGGVEAWRAWHSFVWPRYGCHRSIIVRVTEFERFVRLQERMVEQLGRDTRSESIEWRLLPKVFESTSESRSQALVRAFEDARQKGAALCGTMGCTLGATIRVQEQPPAAPAKSFHPFDDLDDPSSVLYCYGDDSQREPALQQDITTSPVRCFCRFAIHPASSDPAVHLGPPPA